MHVFRFREFGLKTPIHAPKLGFWGIWPPKWGVIWKNHQKGTSLRESALFKASCVKICRRVWPVGEFLKKGINQNNFGYISSMCPKAPPWTDMHLIWHSRRGRRRNYLWQIVWWSVEGVDSVGVENCPFPLTRPVAVNTGLALPRSLWSFCVCACVCPSVNTLTVAFFVDFHQIGHRRVNPQK